MRSRWRSSVFAFILLASVVAGLDWHARTAPVQIPVTEQGGADIAGQWQSQLGIRVYEANPTVPLSVHIEVDGSDDNRAVASVYVRPKLPVDLLIGSSEEDIPDPNQQPLYGRIVSDAGGGGSFGGAPDDAYYYVFRAGAKTHTLGNIGYLVGTFSCGPGTLVKMGGTLTASLPYLATDQSNGLLTPQYAESNGTARTRPHLFNVVDLKHSKILGDNSLSSYTVHTKEKIRELFWQPRNLTSSEALWTGTDLFDNPDMDIQVDLPSSGTVVNGEFVWRGDYGLAPILRVVSRADEDARNRYEFLSGVALATAAAAAVALVQEGPDRLLSIRMRLRLRRFTRRLPLRR